MTTGDTILVAQDTHVVPVARGPLWAHTTHLSDAEYGLRACRAGHL